MAEDLGKGCPFPGQGRSSRQLSLLDLEDFK